MPNPFPGMNPYLENPQYWRAIHAPLIGVLDTAIREQLPPRFVTTVEERVYLSLTEYTYPDVLVLQERDPVAPPQAQTPQGTLIADTPITIALTQEEIVETFLEIRIPGLPERVVTSLEVLSPKNKSRESRGRDAYAAKQSQVLRSDTHLVEIDLLRGGVHTIAAPFDEVAAHHPLPWHYAVCLHRARTANRFAIWVASVQERLPIFTVPLTDDYADIAIVT